MHMVPLCPWVQPLRSSQVMVLWAGIPCQNPQPRFYPHPSLFPLPCNFFVDRHDRLDPLDFADDVD